jgi:hypothetical protein
MSHVYAITARALDADSPSPARLIPLPPHLKRKIAAIDRYGVIQTRQLIKSKMTVEFLAGMFSSCQSIFTFR